MFNNGSSNGIIWRYAVCTLSRLFLNSQIIKSFTKKLTFIVWIWVFVSIIWAAVLHNNTKLSSTWNVYEMWYSSNTLIWVCLCTLLIFIGFLWRLSSAIENQIYGGKITLMFSRFFQMIISQWKIGQVQVGSSFWTFPNYPNSLFKGSKGLVEKTVG